MEILAVVLIVMAIIDIGFACYTIKHYNWQKTLILPMLLIFLAGFISISVGLLVLM